MKSLILEGTTTRGAHIHIYENNLGLLQVEEEE